MEGEYHSNEGHNAKSNEVLTADIQAILDELISIQEGGTPGVSCRQIQETMGWGRDKTICFIRLAMKKNFCVSGPRRKEAGIDGIYRPIPTYIFKKS